MNLRSKSKGKINNSQVPNLSNLNRKRSRSDKKEDKKEGNKEDKKEGNKDNINNNIINIKEDDKEDKLNIIINNEAPDGISDRSCPIAKKCCQLCKFKGCCICTGRPKNLCAHPINMGIIKNY